MVSPTYCIKWQQTETQHKDNSDDKSVLPLHLLGSDGRMFQFQRANLWHPCHRVGLGQGAVHRMQAGFFAGA